ncbi:hypothetical protein [Clostridium perfringens]|uniref:hypothetical protein n=1 Tax=Clostridium perfringens TaxID=1502 RepID=UPI000E11EF58|nr:hypothetical protein [Clostridium perfringens]MDH5087623.1 hypothetical protein [Clostridium perfringens]UBK69755.1 hypothetical protein KLF38_05130 [Clostridium perfringens]UBK72358.1 hypothetical protein KLF32_05225 [Clostridium perfringens]UBK74862.1 hypothetical protein KLF31_05030 [Clostridium perfringens]UBK76115.1 hypothetical protein KLF35_05105 [Clostridium perfringens]
MSLENQRYLWILGVVYFFIVTIIFLIEGSYLKWISIINSFLLGITLFKEKKNLKGI